MEVRPCVAHAQKPLAGPETASEPVTVRRDLYLLPACDPHAVVSHICRHVVLA